MIYIKQEIEQDLSSLNQKSRDSRIGSRINRRNKNAEGETTSYLSGAAAWLAENDLVEAVIALAELNWKKLLRRHDFEAAAAAAAAAAAKIFYSSFNVKIHSIRYENEISLT